MVAVGGETKSGFQTGALLDLLHWLLEDDVLEKEAVFVLGSDAGDPEKTREVQSTVATLREALGPRATLKTWLDLDEVEVPAPDFSSFGQARLHQLERHADQVPPPLAQRLEELVDRPDFLVYSTISQRSSWGGKLRGRRICEFSSDGQVGRLTIGESLRAVLPQDVDFDAIGSGDLHTVSEAAATIRSLVDSGAADELRGPEAALEARVLRGEVPVEVQDVGRLEPAARAGQFPTLFSEGSSPKPLDVLMQHDGTPWVVELKRPKKSSRGTYYRHAVGQAVLYREFVRKATPLHPWFEKDGLTARECRSAVGLPDDQRSSWQIRLQHVKRLAGPFDVAVAVLAD